MEKFPPNDNKEKEVSVKERRERFERENPEYVALLKAAIEANNVDLIDSPIKSLKKPLEKILLQIEPSIEKGAYAAVIGEDGSGRVPALILGEVLGGICEDRGLQKPKILFLAGSGTHMTESAISEKTRDDKVELLVEYLHHQIPGDTLSKQLKVLIVTDTVLTGSSLEPLTKALRKLRIIYEIAAIALPPNSIGIPKLKRRLRASIHTGQSLETKIFKKPDLSGVNKYPEDLFSRPYTRNFAEGEARVVKQDVINRARSVSRHVTNDILKKYRANKKRENVKLKK